MWGNKYLPNSFMRLSKTLMSFNPQTENKPGSKLEMLNSKQSNMTQCVSVSHKPSENNHKPFHFLTFLNTESSSTGLLNVTPGKRGLNCF